MTGIEFQQSLTAAGLTQAEFAATMGVHRTVIGRQYKAKNVDPYWAYALAGFMAVKQARDLTMLVNI